MARDDWMIPGAFEIATDVYRIPLPLPNDGLKAVNVYAFLGDDAVTVIDSGWAVAEGLEALARGLGILGRTLDDIGRFLVTHVHRDHYTQAVTVRTDHGARVSLGEGERATLEYAMTPGSNEMEPQISLMRALGAPEIAVRLAAVDQFPENDIWELPDDWLTGGQTVRAAGRSLDVVPTPGHTQGHVVFHDVTNDLLFAGDHVLPTITPSIGFEPIFQPNPLGDFLGSLDAVRRRPDAMLLPAHGPVAASAHARIDELLEHHDVRLVQTAKAINEGASTAYEAAGTLRWTRRERQLSELDVFNQMLAIAETNAHLLLLEAQGRIVGVVDEGVHRYRPS